jgi:hypothetical protein
VADAWAMRARAVPAPAQAFDYKRLERLLIRDIATNLGREDEMNAKFGRLEPLPGDEMLRAAASGIMARIFGATGAGRAD